MSGPRGKIRNASFGRFATRLACRPPGAGCAGGLWELRWQHTRCGMEAERWPWSSRRGFRPRSRPWLSEVDDIPGTWNLGRGLYTWTWPIADSFYFWAEAPCSPCLGLEKARPNGKSSMPIQADTTGIDRNAWPLKCGNLKQWYSVEPISKYKRKRRRVVIPECLCREPTQF